MSMPFIPYFPPNCAVYELPNGEIARMDEQVTVHTHPGHRVLMEIMLIQKAIGVTPDGIIGLKTRQALAKIARTFEVDGQKMEVIEVSET